MQQLSKQTKLLTQLQLVSVPATYRCIKININDRAMSPLQYLASTKGCICRLLRLRSSQGSVAAALYSPGVELGQT